jgi:hypothetical protein
MPNGAVQLVSLIQAFADCYHNPLVQRALMLPTAHAITRTLSERLPCVLHPIFSIFEVRADSTRPAASLPGSILPTGPRMSLYNGSPARCVKLGYTVYVAVDRPPRSDFFMLIAGERGDACLTAESASHLIELLSNDNFGVLDAIWGAPARASERERPEVCFVGQASPTQPDQASTRYERIDMLLTATERERMLHAWCELLNATT